METEKQEVLRRGDMEQTKMPYIKVGENTWPFL